MKANHILFSALAVTLISAYNMSPSDLAKFKHQSGRLPASEEEVEMPEVRKQEVRSQEIKKQELKKDEVKCIAESKGEKLEKEVKSQTQDIEAVLKEIDELKKENKELKEKVTTKNGKQEGKLSEVESHDTVGVMLAMTSLFTTQMQSQMEIQMQMMNMFAQMQLNQAPQYSWDLSKAYGQQHYGSYESLGIGLPASGIGGYLNPYSQNPQMVRQPAGQMDFGFSYGQIPEARNMRGFDFNLAPTEPLLPQMKREMMPQQLPSPAYNI